MLQTYISEHRMARLCVRCFEVELRGSEGWDGGMARLCVRCFEVELRGSEGWDGPSLREMFRCSHEEVMTGMWMLCVNTFQNHSLQAEFHDWETQ